LKAWDESKLTLQAMKMKLIEEYDRNRCILIRILQSGLLKEPRIWKYQFWSEKSHEKPQFNKFIESRARIGLTMLAKTKECFKNEF